MDMKCYTDQLTHADCLVLPCGIFTVQCKLQNVQSINYSHIRPNTNKIISIRSLRLRTYQSDAKQLIFLKPTSLCQVLPYSQG